MQTTEILDKMIDAVSTNRANTKYANKALNQPSNDNLYSKKPYIVIRSSAVLELESKVIDAINQGYYAQGGVAVSEGIYYQSMILVQ